MKEGDAALCPTQDLSHRLQFQGAGASEFLTLTRAQVRDCSAGKRTGSDTITYSLPVHNVLSSGDHVDCPAMKAWFVSCNTPADSRT